MKRVIALCLLLMVVALVGCERTERVSSPRSTNSAQIHSTNAAGVATASPAPPAPGGVTALPANTPAADDEVAILTTSKGIMVAEFWPDVAPQTVENFKKLAREGFYDGTAFHRIMRDFMIQGGDPLTKDPKQKALYGQGDPGYTIDAEFNERPHDVGVLSMARGLDVNSAGSQFFICLGRVPTLDRQYTVFGKLIKGVEVLKAIGETPVGPNPNMDNEMSVPLEHIGLTSVKIVKRSEIK